MNLARPVFHCSDCCEKLSEADLENDRCSNCEAELCRCICHIANFILCSECKQFHEGQ